MRRMPLNKDSTSYGLEETLVGLENEPKKRDIKWEY